MSLWNSQDAAGAEATKELVLYAYQIYTPSAGDVNTSPLMFRKRIVIEVNRNFVNSSVDSVCNTTLTQNKIHRANYVETELDPILELDWGEDLSLEPRITTGIPIMIYPTFTWSNQTHCQIRPVTDNAMVEATSAPVTIRFEEAFLWWLLHADYPLQD